MIENDNLSFYHCIMLKYLGFDRPVFSFWEAGKRKILSSSIEFSDSTGRFGLYNHNSHHNWVSAPTIREAIKWLREERGLFIEVESIIENGFLIFVSIVKRYKDYNFTIIYRSTDLIYKHDIAEMCGLSFCIDFLAGLEKRGDSNDFYSKLIKNQKDLPPEYAKIIEENFWDLI